MTPLELLKSSPVQTPGDAARILRFMKRNGEPDRAVIYQLIRDRKLPRLFPDDDIPLARWRIPSAAIARLAGIDLESEAS